ncbi:MAG: Deoxyuridine 5'-triphosphate nucleotidohydrolase [Ignavibacteriaceae bacterium]|nr:Deoxyuridine 5'-triphosphate nucleotidohydrolase [Ignavibacteriaceae bacterium]
MAQEIEIKFKRLRKELIHIPLPSYATRGSAGLDIYAALEKPMNITKGSIEMVPTNISVEIPEGFEIQVRPRSGLAAKHGIGILNSPGTIDSDYRGEIKIIIINLGKEDFVIQPAERIAQLIVSKVYTAKFIETDELNNTSRGEGGFGHTGR